MHMQCILQLGNGTAVCFALVAFFALRSAKSRNEIEYCHLYYELVAEVGL